MAFDEEKEDRRLLPSEYPFEEIVSDILKVNPKKEGNCKRYDTGLGWCHGRKEL